MVSWYLVSRSCFVVGDGRSPACLYHVAIVFDCTTVHSVCCLFRLHEPCLQAPCVHLFFILLLTLHFFRMPLPFQLVIDHFRNQQVPACSNMKTSCVLFIACNRSKCCFFSLAGKFVQIYSVSSILMIVILYNLINKGSSDALAQV